MKRLFVLLTLIAGVAGSASAQELITLDSAIARALLHNYDIRIAEVSSRVAATNNTLGAAGFLPNVNGTAGVNTGTSNTVIKFADGRETTNASNTSLSYNAGVTANYTVFAAGRAYILKKQLSAREKLGEVQLRAQIQSTISAVIQAYAAAVNDQQQMVALDSGIALAKARMDLSKAKYDIGTSAKVDYLQARVDYNASRSQRIAQNASRTSSLAQLNALMGEDPEETYEVEDSLQLNLALVPTERSLLENQSLVIDLARRNVEISRLDTRIARTYLFPSVDVNAGYNYNQSRNGAGVTLSNRGFGPSVGLGVSVPIFQGGNLRRQVRVANLNQLSTEISFERQSTEIARQYRSAWAAYQAAVETYNLEEENKGYAKENLDIQQARFRVGIATSIELREAENSYVSTLARLYAAAYNVKVNETRVLEIESRLEP
jgi:outer membrane protein TolC